MQDHFPVVARARAPGLPARKVQEIRCSQCPAVEERSASTNPYPPHTMAAWCAKRGWKVVAVGRHICPACRTKESAHSSPNKASIMAPKLPPAKTAPAPANENAGHASPAASDAIVNLSLFLSDYYDKARKAYAEGWDDDRMARETGLSPVHVAEFREKYFGPLVKDTTLEDIAVATLALAQEIAGLEGEIDALQRTAASAITTCGRLKVSLNALRKAQGRLSAPPVVKAA